MQPTIFSAIPNLHILTNQPRFLTGLLLLYSSLPLGLLVPSRLFFSSAAPRPSCPLSYFCLLLPPCHNPSTTSSYCFAVQLSFLQANCCCRLFSSCSLACQNDKNLCKIKTKASTFHSSCVRKLLSSPSKWYHLHLVLKLFKFEASRILLDQLPLWKRGLIWIETIYFFGVYEYFPLESSGISLLEESNEFFDVESSSFVGKFKYISNYISFCTLLLSLFTCFSNFSRRLPIYLALFIYVLSNMTSQIAINSPLDKIRYPFLSLEFPIIVHFILLYSSLVLFSLGTKA